MSRPLDQRLSIFRAAVTNTLLTLIETVDAVGTLVLGWSAIWYLSFYGYEGVGT